MSKRQSYDCRSFKREDEMHVKKLVKNAFNDFLEGAYWDWKYKLNPLFDQSLVMVAEEQGSIIGCNHWLLKDFKLSPSLETKAALCGDLVVHPDHRNKGVGKALLYSLRVSGVEHREKPSISFMFANPSLAKSFHEPAGGYIPVINETVYYHKILNWKKLKDNIQVFNQQLASGKFKRKLSKCEFTVLFKILQGPPLYLSISERGVKVEQTIQPQKDADVVIMADLTTLNTLKAKRRWSLLRSLIVGRFRIKGKPRLLLTLYRNIWALEEIFSQNII